jgi:hypothetical protein
MIEIKPKSESASPEPQRTDAHAIGVQAAVGERKQGSLWT